jgi:hypothetical protein
MTEDELNARFIVLEIFAMSALAIYLERAERSRLPESRGDAFRIARRCCEFGTISTTIIAAGGRKLCKTSDRPPAGECSCSPRRRRPIALNDSL